MKLSEIEYKNQDLINKFFTKNKMEAIVNNINFELNDEAPDKSYYSYYCEIEGRKFGIKIDYDENYIMIHVNYKHKLINYIDKL